MGIKKIQGNLIVDGSLFSDKSWDTSRDKAIRVSSNAYNAPISAIAINFNTFPIIVSPGYSSNRKALVSIDPYHLNNIKIVNNTVKVPGSKNYAKALRKRESNSEILLVSGKVGKSANLRKIYRSVSHPLIMAGQQIKSFLQHESITVKGKVSVGRNPPTSQHLYTIKGYPLSKIIEGLNKYSNNHIADTLIKDLAAYHGEDKIGSLKKGLRIMNQILQSRYSIDEDLILLNGSGLNPGNRVSASHVVSLLTKAYNRMIVFPEFFQSLPSSGRDGTLKDRFKNEQPKGFIRAKTGTLTSPISVSSLAGYFMHKSHGLVAFAIIDNGVKGTPQPPITDLQARQERLVNQLIQSN